MTAHPVKNTSLGQAQELSLIDRFGRYLSERRILKTLRHRGMDKTVMLDIGCGYDAWILRKCASLFASGVAVDVAISNEVKSMDNIRVYERPVENVLPDFDPNYFDIILMNSVLEHLTDPLSILIECRRILKKGGILMINVPTWLGKYFLERSAFFFALSPAEEIDDHKMYYDKRDLWPMLVRAGFKPSSITMKYHKFRLNLFATCCKTFVVI